MCSVILILVSCRQLYLVVDISVCIYFFFSGLFLLSYSRLTPILGHVFCCISNHSLYYFDDCIDTSDCVYGFVLIFRYKLLLTCHVFCCISNDLIDYFVDCVDTSDCDYGFVYKFRYNLLSYSVYLLCDIFSQLQTSCLNLLISQV